jgi:hypothetical protein
MLYRTKMALLRFLIGDVDQALFAVLTRNLDRTLFAKTTNGAFGLSVRDRTLPDEANESGLRPVFHTDTEARGPVNARVLKNVCGGQSFVGRRSLNGKVSLFFERHFRQNVISHGVLAFTDC